MMEKDHRPTANLGVVCSRRRSNSLPSWRPAARPAAENRFPRYRYPCAAASAPPCDPPILRTPPASLCGSGDELFSRRERCVDKGATPCLRAPAAMSPAGRPRLTCRDRAVAVRAWFCLIGASGSGCSRSALGSERSGALPPLHTHRPFSASNKSRIPLPTQIQREAVERGPPQWRGGSPRGERPSPCLTVKAALQASQIPMIQTGTASNEGVGVPSQPPTAPLCTRGGKIQ